MTASLKYFMIPVILAILTLFFLGQLIFLPDGKALPGSDFREIHYPLLKFISDATHETGTLPLWNPHQYLGYSVVGNPQYGLFYPPNLALLLLQGDSLYHGIAIIIALHVFWMALGTAYFMRLFGADRWSALLAGILVAFGGTNLVRVYAGHYALFLTLAWSPWILAGYRLAVEKRGVWWTIPGAVALALGILAGHPQTIYIIGLGLAVQWVYELLTAATWPQRINRTRQLMLIGLMAAVLSAILLLPTFDYAGKTSRGSETSVDFANEHHLEANELSTWFIPHLFGTPQNTPPGYWLDQPLFEEMFGYIGLLPLMLLLATIRQPRIYFFAALVVLGILLSVGVEGGLYLAQYRWIPLAKNFRAPGRNLILTSIGLAGITALTLTHYAQIDREARRQMMQPLLRWVVPFGLITLWGGGLLLSIAASLLKDDAASRASYLAGQLGLSGLFWLLNGLVLWSWTQDNSPHASYAIALTLIIVLTDLWHVTWPLVETKEAEGYPAWEWAEKSLAQQHDYGRIMQTVPPVSVSNGASWIGYDSDQGYDPLVPDLWWDLIQYTDWYPNTTISRLMAVRYILTNSSNWAATDNFQQIAAEDPYFLFTNPDALPRAYLASRYEVVTDAKMMLVRLAVGHADGGDLVLLDHDPRCAVGGKDGTAAITHYEPNTVTVETETPTTSFLVLVDQYDKNWKVTIDGKKAALLRTNYAMRGVCIPDGKHTVQFKYRPLAYLWGRAISLVGWLALLVVAIIAASRRLINNRRHAIIEGGK